MKKQFTLGAGLLVLGVLLAACGSTITPAPIVQEVPVTVEVPVVQTQIVEVQVTVEPAVQVPFEALWASSPHADAEAEAFVHWNEDDPAEVPADCARCHSTSGYRDFVGADGSPAGTVEANAPIGEVISCEACHSEATQAMSSVSFPSGAEITGLGAEARCMQCHQGRAAGISVDEAITNAGLTDDDTVSEDLGFTNIHYFAAAVSRYGAQVKGGYEYPGQSYDVLFDHVAGVQACTDCHNSHSLEIKIDTCAACHGVTSTEELRNVRMASSTVDYDGDGDVEEGIFFELEGVREKLFLGMQAYASEVAGKRLVYDTATYPYFFIDANANGALEEDETAFENKFNAWTGRLAKAAYNYQTSLKDPGAYAHGGKYIIQLLFDSLADLNSALDAPVDMAGMHRIDAGHFAGSEEAFRHWDAEGDVPGTCAKCHSATGLPTFLANAANIATHPANGLMCETCHNDVQAFTRYTVDSVRFPSGATVSFGEGAEANLCINCHQGRESTVSVDNAIRAAAVGDDEVSEALRFRNVHYFAAGATLFGADAKGAYEYAGQEYLGQFTHGNDGGIGGPADCVSCHQTHALVVNVEECADCHRTVETVEDLQTIRVSEVDYDGDGDVTEGLAGEIATLQEALYAAIQAYAADTAGTALVYDTHAYPYFFADANANGAVDEGEEGYASWTPGLLRAAYNYQYAQKDPGAFAHNGKYIIQILYDSL
ncbi:MAG: hypothetical protein IT318_25175, partial [Anaerolineales bacterium]|nr:hypothetical protein [Anaerolineales bacterium]